jgi:hypothetical protein
VTDLKRRLHNAGGRIDLAELCWEAEARIIALEADIIQIEKVSDFNVDRVKELEKALRRIGSMEAFELARAVDGTGPDAELLARIEYARKAVGETA